MGREGDGEREYKREAALYAHNKHAKASAALPHTQWLR